MTPVEQIKFLRGYSHMEPIHEGYSSDQKYLVVKDGQNYLLRIFDPSVIPEKEKEFAVMEKMIQYQVRSCRPLEMGYTENRELGYMLLTFIDGADGFKALPSLPEKVQFRIGIEAGVELKKMHQYKAPEAVSPWHERKGAKHERYLK